MEWAAPRPVKNPVLTVPNKKFIPTPSPELRSPAPQFPYQKPSLRHVDLFKTCAREPLQDQQLLSCLQPYTLDNAHELQQPQSPASLSLYHSFFLQSLKSHTML